MAEPFTQPLGTNLNAHQPPDDPMEAYALPPTPGAPTNPKITTGTNVKRYVCKIRIEYPTPRNNGTFYAQPKVRETLAALKAKEPSLKIIALEDANLIVDELKNLPTDAKEIQKFITYKRFSPPNSGPKETIVARIEVGRPFYEIKKDIMEYLGTNGIYIRPHDWSCTEVKAIGFLSNYNPSLIWREDGKKLLDNILQGVLSKVNLNEIPTFKIVKMPKAYGNDDDRIKTQVGEIHCAAADAASLKKAFTSQAYADQGMFPFIPEGILQVHGPDVFKNILLAQNRYLNGQRTIAIENLTEAALELDVDDKGTTIKECITSGPSGSPLKLEIHRTSNTLITGKWLVSFPNEDAEKARIHINYVLMSIFPMAYKNDGTNNKDYLFNNAHPTIAGRPNVDPEMNACFQNIAASYGNPQNGDDAPDNREIQSHKKRRTDTAITSYAAKANAPIPAKNAWNTPAATATTSTAPSLEAIQTMMEAKFAAQTKVTEDLLTAQSNRNMHQMNLLADEQNKKLDNQQRIITKFVQEAIHANNKDITKGLNEHLQETLKINAENLGALLTTQTGSLLQKLEIKMMADMEVMKEQFFSRSRNRMDLDEDNAYSLQPTGNSDQAGGDTTMSPYGPQP